MSRPTCCATTPMAPGSASSRRRHLPTSLPTWWPPSIGARIRPNLSAERSVIDRVGDTKLLILLDNCEHLLEGAGKFAEALLVSCPELRILATSRERLGVAGEQVWPLGPLSVPDASGLGPLGQSEAVALFADRAASVKPSFTISPANAAAVDEICRRLDGIPLAIELAAARVAAMTPTEIASNLDRRFRLLKGGRDERSPPPDARGDARLVVLLPRGKPTDGLQPARRLLRPVRRARRRGDRRARWRGSVGRARRVGRAGRKVDGDGRGLE